MSEEWTKEAIERVATKRVDEKIKTVLDYVRAYLNTKGFQNLRLELGNHKEVDLVEVLASVSNCQPYTNILVFRQQLIEKEEKNIEDSLIENASKVRR